MKTLKTYKQWEAVRLKGALTDYKFVYDHKSDEGHIFLTFGDKGTARLDVRALGKPVGGKYEEFMFAWPQDIQLNSMFDFHFAANEIIRIFNKNKRRFRMLFGKVENHTKSQGALALKPWIEVKVEPMISLDEMEEIFGLTKLKDNEVKPKNIYDPVYRKLKEGSIFADMNERKKPRYSSDVNLAIALGEFEEWYVRGGKVQKELYELFINRSKKFNRYLKNVLSKKFKTECLIYPNFFSECKGVIKQIG